MFLLLYRQMSLIRQRNSLTKQLMDEKQKLYDIQSYAATLGQGRLTPASIASLPGSVFGDGFRFMNMSNQLALQSATQKFSIFEQAGMMPQGGTPAQQQQMRRYYFNCFAEQAFQQMRKSKEIELNKMEKEIDIRSARIQQRLQAVEAELDSVKGAVEQRSSQDAPKYA